MATNALEDLDSGPDHTSTIRAQASFPKAAEYEWLVYQAGARTRKDHPEKTIRVLTRCKCLVESTDREEMSAPEGRQPEDEVVVDRAEPLVVDDEAGCVTVVTANDASIDLQVGIRSEDVEVWSGRGELTERFDSFGEIDVVRIELDDEFTRRCTSRSVERRRESGVALANKPYALVEGRKGVFECVARAVVAHDDLVRRNRLS